MSAAAIIGALLIVYGIINLFPAVERTRVPTYIPTPTKAERRKQRLDNLVFDLIAFAVLCPILIVFMLAQG